MKQRTSTLLAVAALTAAFAAHAQQPAKKASPQAKAAAPEKRHHSKEFEKFREVLEEDNPAELFEAKGEDIWKNKKGPNGASMAQCDLGLGAGVVKGAYVQMPRWFADVGQVMDAERRVVHCMVKYLGYKEEDIRKQPFSNVNKTPDHVSVITYVAAQSRNMKIAAPQKHPKGSRNLQHRQGDLRLPRRPLRLLLRHLPRRRRQAHPHAGPAEPEEARPKPSAPTRAGRATA
jgi:hypothetical protein